MNNEDYKSLLEKALSQKDALRKELRNLPIEDKIIIIALMQRRSNQIRREVGRPEQAEWPWEELNSSHNQSARQSTIVAAMKTLLESQ